MSRKGRLSRISSFSSEDPNHPASNLLVPETFRKWKCKDPGEKTAFVIIQLDKVEKIISIDIGNESSAFIEVSVARSIGEEAPEFQVIQNQTAFMTVTDSKTETNTNRVKMFSSSLVKSVAAEKWDLIKVTCIQPFNDHIQYGISFLNIVVERDPSEDVMMGGFRIMKTAVKDDDVDDDPIRIGSFFAKRMEASGHSITGVTEKSSPSPSPSIAATMRGLPSSSSSSTSARNEDKTNDTGSEKSKSDKVTVALSRRDAAGASTSSDVASPKDLSSNSKTSQGSSGTTRGADVNTKKIQRPTSSAQQSHSSPKPTAPKLQSPPAASSRRKKKLRKPFNKLFEGVVFVISGYENPYRSELRRKAVEMGGQCKPEWNPSCTHLICAFVNTPKFRQVKGSRSGKIVTKNWIEDSYRKKCRFPWRRYCLDKADKGTESEEEVHAAGESSDSESEESNDGYTLAVDILNSQESGVVMDHDSNSTQPKDGERDDETDFEEDENDLLISPRSTNEKSSNGRVGTKRRRIARISSSSSSDDAAYDVDTEVDEPQVSFTHTNDFSISDGEAESNHLHRHNKYNDFFNSKLFFLHPTQSLRQDQRKEIETIIRQHKGSLVTQCNKDVDYIVTWENKWIDEFSQFLAENPDLVVVGDSWIYKCGEANEMALIEPFVILPE